MITCWVGAGIQLSSSHGLHPLPFSTYTFGQNNLAGLAGREEYRSSVCVWEWEWGGRPSGQSDKSSSLIPQKRQSARLGIHIKVHASFYCQWAIRCFHVRLEVLWQHVFPGRLSSSCTSENVSAFYKRWSNLKWVEGLGFCLCVNTASSPPVLSRSDTPPCSLSPALHQFKGFKTCVGRSPTPTKLYQNARISLSFFHFCLN